MICHKHGMDSGMKRSDEDYLALCTTAFFFTLFGLVCEVEEKSEAGNERNKRSQISQRVSLLLRKCVSFFLNKFAFSSP